MIINENDSSVGSSVMVPLLPSLSSISALSSRRLGTTLFLVTCGSPSILSVLPRHIHETEPILFVVLFVISIVLMLMSTTFLMRSLKILHHSSTFGEIGVDSSTVRESPVRILQIAFRYRPVTLLFLVMLWAHWVATASYGVRVGGEIIASTTTSSMTQTERIGFIGLFTVIVSLLPDDYGYVIDSLCILATMWMSAMNFGAMSIEGVHASFDQSKKGWVTTSILVEMCAIWTVQWVPWALQYTQPNKQTLYESQRYHLLSIPIALLVIAAKGYRIPRDFTMIDCVGVPSLLMRSSLFVKMASHLITAVLVTSSSCMGSVGGSKFKVISAGIHIIVGAIATAVAVYYPPSVYIGLGWIVSVFNILLCIVAASWVYLMAHREGARGSVLVRVSAYALMVVGIAILLSAMSLKLAQQ